MRSKLNISQVLSHLTSAGKSLKHYVTDEERTLRSRIVRENLAKISEHNSKNPSWTMVR